MEQFTQMQQQSGMQPVSVIKVNINEKEPPTQVGKLNVQPKEKECSKLWK